MAKIEICGITCSFPQVPKGTLESYGVTPRTHYLAYKIPSVPILAATISGLFSAAYEIGAMERPAFFVQDEDGRAIVLLEHPSHTVLDNILSWLAWTVGTQTVSFCPYTKAVTELRDQADKQHKDITLEIEYRYYDKLYKKTLGNGAPLNAPEDHTTD